MGNAVRSEADAVPSELAYLVPCHERLFLHPGRLSRPTVSAGAECRGHKDGGGQLQALQRRSSMGVEIGKRVIKRQRDASLRERLTASEAFHEIAERKHAGVGAEPLYLRGKYRGRNF